MTEYLKKAVVVIAAAGCIALVTSPAKADPEVGVEVTADIVSDYVWRGITFTDEPVIQPSVTLSYGSLALNVWGSIDMTDVNEGMGNDYRVQEVDYTLSYGFAPAEGLDMELGIIEYDFPGTGVDDTQEVYVSVSASGLPGAPTLAVYRDIDEADGWYANASVSHSIPLTEQLSLDLSASLGWGDADHNAFNYGPAEDGLADAAVSASLAYTVNDSLSLSAYLTYSDIIDDELSDALADPDVLFGGVGIAYSF